METTSKSLPQLYIHLVRRSNGTLSVACGKYDAAKLAKGASMHDASSRTGEKTLTSDEYEALKSVLNPIISPLLKGGVDGLSDTESGGSHKKRVEQPRYRKSASNGMKPADTKSALAESTHGAGMKPAE
jgi:hypothetical protein